MNDKYTIVFEISGLPPMTNNSSRKCWQARMKESNTWKNLVINKCWGKEPPDPLKKARLVLTRYSTKEPDFDGLVSGFKHVIDGLKKSNVIFDDKVSIIGNPTYKWEYCGKGLGKVKVEVYEE